MIEYAEVETTNGRHTCWTDGYRKINHNVAMISLYGHRNMVAAISAHMSQEGYVDVKGHDTYMHLDKKASYVPRIKGNLGDNEDMHHVIIVDRQATSQSSAWEPTFYQLAEDEDEAAVKWIAKFARLCRVPVITNEAWGRALWKVGVENHLIHSARGFGLGMWSIATNTDKWHPLISDAARQGLLTMG